MIQERIAAGVMIDRKVVVAIGRGVIKSQQPKNCEALLPHLTGSWARSMMTRMGLIHQNGSDYILLGIRLGIFQNSLVTSLQ